MIRIFLDDYRPCPEGYVLARNYREMIKLLRRNKGQIEGLSLDHDLGEDKSGYDVCKWIVENDSYPTDFITVHSQNPIGARNMMQLLTRYAPDTCDIRDKYGNHYYGY